MRWLCLVVPLFLGINGWRDVFYTRNSAGTREPIKVEKGEP